MNKFEKTLKNIQTVSNVLIQKKYPVGLIHFVTNRCNARCPFCFIDFANQKTQLKSNELTLDEISKMTKTLGPSLQHVNLTGGEPFLRPDLIDIARCYFDNANVKSILIASNGSFPERIKIFAEKLSNEYPDRKLYFSFSIDSVPKRHEEIRKIPGLFERVIESYRIIQGIGGIASASINLTCTEENHYDVNEIYDILKNQYGIESFTAGIARNEGVYKIPAEHKSKIHEAYQKLTGKIVEDVRNSATRGVDVSLLRGRLLEAKIEIQYKIIAETYIQPKFRSLCPAGSIFGVIGADGTVYSCEILGKDMGHLRESDLNFLKLWNSEKALELKSWICKSKCNCHWENAWTYNILSNVKYHPILLKKVIGLAKP